MDLAKSIGPSSKIKFIGVRPGEKIHEEMITESDSDTTYDIGDYYIILPSKNKEIIRKYKKFNIKRYIQILVIIQAKTKVFNYSGN